MADRPAFRWLTYNPVRLRALQEVRGCENVEAAKRAAEIPGAVGARSERTRTPGGAARAPGELSTYGANLNLVAGAGAEHIVGAR